ncbi:lipocalin-like domain-containing protein [Echinimonas agarilytica]|uniref:AttH domain-containing protein n=1 Tax=Echinimonas agarilytica TaxID=1215918 RepID=A0AA41W7X8_9GAMM|nr:lipocalin-like domain-containing protein [Echinimonas agarilytica]MCM2680073.1 hypothetical protein [Echinimonas agarilytica]
MMRTLFALPLAISLLAALLSTGCTEPKPDENTGYQVMLSSNSPHYSYADGSETLRFPADHGNHPDYRLEWWYVTGNLSDAKGNWYGVQWTLFRYGLDAPEHLGDTRQMLMAHAAISWQGGHHPMQKYSRAGTGQAGIVSQPDAPFSAWIDQWQLSSQHQTWLPLVMQAGDETASMNLVLESDQPLVLQGDKGFSVKNEQGSGSYYYSHPYLNVAGDLMIKGEIIKVTGQAWLDREWSSQFLLPQQAGWDWLALHLDNGEKVMVYHLRSHEGDHRRFLSWFGKNGETVLKTDQFELSQSHYSSVQGRQIPQQWHVKHTQTGLDLHIKTRQKEQWMDLDSAYWEGPVQFTGSHAGQGYLEMTGYDTSQ